MVKKINSDQTKIANDLLKSYRYVFFCKRKQCGKMYGCDFKKDNGLCPICEKKVMNNSLKVSRTKQRRKRKRMVLT